MEKTKKTSENKNLGLLLQNILPYMGLILVVVVFGIASKGVLFSAYNVKSILTQTAPIILMSMGAVFIYSLGNMDVSMGSAVGMCGLGSCLVMNATGSLPLAVLTSLAVALVFSLINSVVSGLLGILPILASVCTMMVGRGIIMIVTTNAGGSGIKVAHDISILKQVPLQLTVVVIAAIVFAYLFKFTSIGKYARSVGANAAYARENGIDPFKVQVICYLILGISIGIASIFIWSNTGNITRSSGQGYEMDVMIALILGGMSLNGGMGSKFSSAIIGSFTYIILKNGLLLSSFLEYNQVDMAKAVIFVVMVVITCRQKGNLLPK